MNKLLITAGAGIAAAGAYLGLRPTEMSLRKKVVKAAESQVGRTDPTPYWLDVSGSAQSASLSWCGAFALWSLHQAGLALQKSWTFGKGFLLTQPTPLYATQNPKPGDVAYFQNLQHQAVVAAVYSDGTMRLVNGNGTNRTVTISTRPIREATAIYSIQPYIELKLGKTLS